MSVRGILDKVREEDADRMTGLTSLLCPEVCVSMLGLTVTSSSWDFYQSSIAPYLSASFHISPSLIGKLSSSAAASCKKNLILRADTAEPGVNLHPCLHTGWLHSGQNQSSDLVPGAGHTHHLSWLHHICSHPPDKTDKISPHHGYRTCNTRSRLWVCLHW